MNEVIQNLFKLATQTFVMEELITFDHVNRCIDAGQWLKVFPHKFHPMLIELIKKAEGGRFINRRMDNKTRREFITQLQNELEVVDRRHSIDWLAILLG